MNIKPVSLIALATLAILAGSIEQSQAQNHWTNAGASPGGGFIINGNSAPTDLGTLSQGSAPVFLSPNGFNIITLDAGNTATASTDTITLGETGDMLTNLGTLVATNNMALDVQSNGNSISNS